MEEKAVPARDAENEALPSTSAATQPANQQSSTEPPKESESRGSVTQPSVEVIAQSATKLVATNVSTSAETPAIPANISQSILKTEATTAHKPAADENPAQLIFKTEATTSVHKPAASANLSQSILKTEATTSAHKPAPSANLSQSRLKTETSASAHTPAASANLSQSILKTEASSSAHTPAAPANSLRSVLKTQATISSQATSVEGTEPLETGSSTTRLSKISKTETESVVSSRDSISLPEALNLDDVLKDAVDKSSDEESDEDECNDENQLPDARRTQSVTAMEHRRAERNLRNIFLDSVQGIPELEDISSTESIQTLMKTSSRVTFTEARDLGTFVDPITGEIMSSRSAEDGAETHSVGEELDEEEPEEEAEDDDMLLGIDNETEVEIEIPLQDSELYLQLTEQKKTPKVVEYEIGTQIRYADSVTENLRGFVEKLITQAIDMSEQQAPRIKVQNNMDKELLMDELIMAQRVLEEERKINTFLNRKIVDYHRRAKKFQAITVDDNEYLLAKKYKEALIRLDTAMGGEEETKIEMQRTIDELQTELSDSAVSTEAEIQKLNDMFMKTFVRENDIKMKGVAEKCLKQMSDIRDEISTTRRHLLEKMHIYATLDDKLKRLEDIGNGLNISDFEHLYAKVTALQVKNDDRGIELEKVRARYTTKLNIISHIREKELMLGRITMARAHKLGILTEEKHQVRKHLHDLKLERSSIRRDIQDVSFQCGLLDKPLLLQDYDKTVDNLEAMRGRVNQLRRKHVDLQQKLQTVEQRLRGSK